MFCKKEDWKEFFVSRSRVLFSRLNIFKRHSWLCPWTYMYNVFQPEKVYNDSVPHVELLLHYLNKTWMVYNYEKFIRALPYPFIQITSGYKIRCRFTLTNPKHNKPWNKGNSITTKTAKITINKKNTMDEIIDILLIFMLYYSL